MRSGAIFWWVVFLYSCHHLCLFAACSSPSLSIPTTISSFIYTERQNYSAVVVSEQFVYLIGGFYHQSQAIEQVEVYYLNGTQKEDSNVTSMITPRGFLSTILLDRRYIVAAGGSTAINSAPLSIIEVLDTQTGEWVGSADLPFNCTNPSLALHGTGGIIAICPNLMTVSFINITQGSGFNLPPLPRQACEEGAIGSNQGYEESALDFPLLYFCSEGTFLLDSYNGWNNVNELFEWQSVSVRYPISSINPELSMFSSNYATPFFVFTTANNSLNYSPCFVMDYCYGQLFYTNNQLICVEDFEVVHVLEREKTSLHAENEEIFDGSIYQSSWSMFMGNAQRSGQSSGKWDCYPLNSTKALVWLQEKSPASNFILTNSTPNSIIFSSSDGIDSIDSTTGAFENSDNQTVGYPIIALNPNYSLGFNNIVAFSSQKLCTLGSWCTNTQYGFNELTVGIDGSIYLFGSAGVSVFSGTTGDLLWNITLLNPSLAITQDGAMVLVVGQPFLLSGTYCYGFWSKTGNLQWKYLFDKYSKESQGNIVVGPNGLVYVTYGTLIYSLEAMTGVLKWKFKNIIVEEFYDSPLVVGNDGTIYTEGGSGTIYAIDGITGLVKWTSCCFMGEYVTMAITSDGNLFKVDSGCIGVLDGRTGALLWSFKFGNAISIGSYPVIAPDGTVIAVANNAFLVGFRGSAAVSSSWINIPLLS